MRCRTFVCFVVAALPAVAITATMPFSSAQEGPPSTSKPTTSAADAQPATTQEAKAVERADFAKRVADVPAIGPYEVSQVLQIRTQDKRIVVSSPLESFDGQRLVKLGHPDDGATIHFHPMGASNAPDQPRFIQFYRYDFRDPKVVFVHTSAVGYPGSAQITGAWQYLDRMRDVQLIDTDEKIADDGSQTEASIRLLVQGFDDDGNVTHKVEYKATDLRTLQREHPAEVNEYVRPVLRELEAESILDVDPAVAWQVFAAEARPDPKVVARVNELLPGLDAATFQDREAAAEAMKKLGTGGALAMLQLDRSKLTPEQNTRIEEILGSFQQLDPRQATRLREDTAFLLSVLGADDRELRRVASAQLTRKVGGRIEFDPDAPAEPRRQAVDALRRRLLPPATTQAVEK